MIRKYFQNRDSVELRGEEAEDEDDELNESD
jgi:hypothetical protein